MKREFKTRIWIFNGQSLDFLFIREIVKKEANTSGLSRVFGGHRGIGKREGNRNTCGIGQ